MGGLLIVRGISKLTPEYVRAIDTASHDADLIREADVVVGIHGYEATIVKHPARAVPAPIPMVDLRQRSQQYREDGEALVVQLGQEAKEADVTTISGIPIRGITRVTIEDDVNGGRAVILRLREMEVLFPPTPPIIE